MKRKSIFAVRCEVDKSLWHTGEFDRSVPPCGYVSGWNDAAIWTSKTAAKQYAKEFGGVVVEFKINEEKE